MSEYRDELAAAHARIAELEEKVRILEEEASPALRPNDGRFPELEAEVARLREAADPGKNARLRTSLSIVGAVFPLVGMIFTFMKLPILATGCSVIFMGLIAAGFYFTSRLKKDTRLLHEATAKLGDARRIADLEQKLADVRTRIATDDDGDRELEPEPLAEERAQRR